MLTRQTNRILSQIKVSQLRNFSTQLKLGDRLAGKVALVTGGGAGIGRASCLAFAAQGAKVVVADKDEKSAIETVKQIDKLLGSTGSSIYTSVDVTKANDCEKMISLTESHFKHLNILFNNAGISHADDNAEDTTEDVWDLTMLVNVKGVFLGCKYGIPALLRAGGGSIINTASFVAVLGAATPQLAYTASKGAVLSMTRELATIHARKNIRVNALCPGPLNTELLMKYLNTPEKKNRRLVHVPMGRFGEAQEIANAALYLASDESSFVTGSTFLVDGGITAAYVTPE
eukprot:TRINITY_DN169_c2_g2_i2.p1 TRINITY_DN169_c2_g2~~TRINITY_DN169_c2_g2_i2.p1  ORF type:complete len:288 (-),score=172.57 TRINITY_DN169_c2_g2_i2:121-984(-)